MHYSDSGGRSLPVPDMVQLSVRISRQQMAKLKEISRTSRRTRTDVIRALIDLASAEGLNDLSLRSESSGDGPQDQGNQE